MDHRSFRTALPSGTQLYMRPLRPHDRARLSAAIDEMSDHSRYMRFFSGMKTVPEPVLNRLIDVDGDRHIAWGAMDISQSEYKAIGAVHAVRTNDKAQADLSMAVLDTYHGQGIARLLLAAVVSDCLAQGIHTLTADTLSENTKAKTLLRALGGLSASSGGPVVGYRLNTAAMQRKLYAELSTPTMKDLKATLERHSSLALTA